MGLFGKKQVADERQAVPIGVPIPNTVPAQHTFALNREALSRLPVAQRCLSTITDFINTCDPEIVNLSGEVVYNANNLPRWVAQPSGEYVLAELVSQSVWSLFTHGELRLLASLNSRKAPTGLYVGTSNLRTFEADNGQTIYEISDITAGTGGNKNLIQANAISVRRRLARPGWQHGLTPDEAANVLFSAALHAQEVIEKFMGSNMHLDVVFSLDGEWVKGAAQELARIILARHGGPRNAFRPLITERKWKVDRVRDNNRENQLTELVAQLNSDICALVFGIDPLLYNQHGGHGSGQLNYTNSANLRSQVWSTACAPIAKLIEGAISDFLPATQLFKFNPTEMLRGSPHDRAQLVTQMAAVNASAGKTVFSTEEIRSVVGLVGVPEDETVKEPAPMMMGEMPNMEADEGDTEQEAD